jgi:hypothetical protein
VTLYNVFAPFLPINCFIPSHLLQAFFTLCSSPPPPPPLLSSLTFFAQTCCFVVLHLTRGFLCSKLQKHIAQRSLLLRPSSWSMSFRLKSQKCCANLNLKQKQQNCDTKRQMISDNFAISRMIMSTCGSGRTNQVIFGRPTTTRSLFRLFSAPAPVALQLPFQLLPDYGY